MVIEVSSGQIVPPRTPDRFKAIRQWAMENLRGQKIPSEALGKPDTIGRTGIDKALNGAGDDILSAFPLIPALIARGGRTGETTPPRNATEAISTRAWHVLSNVVVIDGREMRMFVHIREDRSGHYFYNIGKAEGGAEPTMKAGGVDPNGPMRSSNGPTPLVDIGAQGAQAKAEASSVTYLQRQFRPVAVSTVTAEHGSNPRTGRAYSRGAKGDGSMNEAYQRLTERFRLIATIGECASMLGWDAAAVMPVGGGAARGDQLAALAVLRHERLVAPEVADDLAAAEASGPWGEANLRLMRHAYTRSKALPADLVEALAKTCSDCEKIWRIARKESDFAMVRPHLEQVLRLTRESGAAFGSALGLDPYDALMDGYQSGIGAADVAPVFAAYEAFLAEALPAIEARQAAQPAPVRPEGPFPIDKQAGLCKEISARLGLDFDHARLDQSAHPFSGGTQTDVRITTRYEESDFASAILAVVHETGHALYERGLPADWARQPVGEAAGMAVHESQSLIVEMQAFRSDAFLTWLGERLYQTFGGDPSIYALGNLGRLWRRVGRSYIRVDADEVTYPAHVILRFRLEQALIAGDLTVADLPGAWSDGLHALLGIRPPDDARGCLQDIHWYDGAFGYFPSYTLGAMSAAQLMAAARAAVPDMDAAFAAGDLSPLLGWLRVHVHGIGSRLGMTEILRGATGRGLDPSAFTDHLTARYLSGTT